MSVGVLLANVKAECRDLLLEAEAKQLLSLQGIPTTLCSEAKSADEAVALAESIGYPVVLKALSLKAIHKSDIGGVQLNLRNAQEVRQGYEAIAAVLVPVDQAGTVTVQEMVQAGIETIVGVTRDVHFGPILMFGLGGVFTEILGDMAFALIPIREGDAWRMITSVKGYPLLQGYRGEPRVNLDSIIDILLRLSSLVEEHPEIEELDLNPVIVHENDAIVVDARIRIGCRQSA